MKFMTKSYMMMWYMYLLLLCLGRCFFVTFNGLSKSHRIAGFRAGWMVLSGNKSIARDYIEGLKMLSAMRLCSNVPAQFAIQTALGGIPKFNRIIGTRRSFA